MADINLYDLNKTSHLVAGNIARSAKSKSALFSKFKTSLESNYKILPYTLFISTNPSATTAKCALIFDFSL